MTLPWLAGFVLFFILPFIGGIYYSLIDSPVRMNFVGPQNYIDLFGQSSFVLAIKNTFLFVLLCTPPLVIFSFIIAGMIHFLRGRTSALQWFLFMPMVIPSAVAVGLWRLCFETGGFVNNILAALAIEAPDWFLDDSMRLPIWLLYIWRNLGFGVIIYLSAWNAIPRELYDACSIDGGRRSLFFRKIAFPMLIPATMVLSILSVINSFKIFKEVFFLGGAYPARAVYTLQHYINNQFTRLDYQKLTAGSYFFAIIVLLFLVAYKILLSRRKNLMDYENEN